MQVGAVSSLNFKSNKSKDYDYVVPKSQGNFSLIDTEETLDDIEKIRNLENTVLKKTKVVIDENGEAHEVKSPVQTAVSLIGTALVAFAFSKKICKTANQSISSIINNDKIKALGTKIKDKLQGTIDGSQKLSAVKNSFSKSKSINAIKNSKPVTNASNYINTKAEKYGAAKVAENIAGVTGATAATIYASRSDSNNDGIADVAERGVKWYDGLIKKGGIVADAVDALS